MKLLILIGIILIGFAIYTFLSVPSSVVAQPVQPVQQYVPPPSMQQKVQEEEQQEPQQQQKQRTIEKHNSPASNDQMSDSYRTAGEDDTFRHPENLFRPAPESNNTAIAVESGAASMITQMQQYKPELVQNGGRFFDQIVPASAMNDDNYSSFN